MIIDWLTPCPSLCTDPPPPPPQETFSDFSWGEGGAVCTKASPVHTYPFSFKKAYFFLRFGLPSTRIQWNGHRKRRLFVNVWTDESGGFRIRWCHTWYTSSMTHAPKGMLSYLHCFSVSVWMGRFLANISTMNVFSSSYKACEISRSSSLLAAGDVPRGGTSATQRQKFHTDDVKSVPNPVRSADWSTE